VRGVGPRTLERLASLVCAGSECAEHPDAGASATAATATPAMP
jgi:hypothetical protein